MPKIQESRVTDFILLKAVGFLKKIVKTRMKLSSSRNDSNTRLSSDWPGPPGSCRVQCKLQYRLPQTDHCPAFHCHHDRVQGKTRRAGR